MQRPERGRNAGQRRGVAGIPGGKYRLSQRSPNNAEEEKTREEMDQQVSRVVAGQVVGPECAVEGERQVQQRPSADRAAAVTPGEKRGGQAVEAWIFDDGVFVIEKEGNLEGIPIGGKEAGGQYEHRKQ